MPSSFLRLFFILTAHVIGMVVSKPRAASWVARISVLGLYILPVLGQAGISFCPSSLIHILRGRFSLTCLQKEQINWEDLRANWPSGRRFLFHHNGFPTTFTFGMQGLLLLAPFVRHTANGSDSCALSKTTAIGLFLILQFLLLGSLWSFSSLGKASGLLGQALQLDPAKTGLPNQLKHATQPAVAMIVVQSTFFLLNLAALLVLINICCPNPHLRLRGVQRKERLGISQIPFLADEAPGGTFVLLLSFICISVFACLHYLAISSEQVNAVSLHQCGLSSWHCFLFGSFFASARTMVQYRILGICGGLWILLACLVLTVMTSEIHSNASPCFPLPITFFPQLIVYVSPDLMSEGPRLINLSSTIQTGIIASILLVIVLTFTLFRSNRT